MAQSVAAFVRKTGIVAGICNVALNPVFAWLGNLGRTDTPLLAGGGSAVDTVITCLIMSLLVSLCITAETRRALAAGSIDAAGEGPRAGCLLCRLPSKAWKLGLVLGGVAAVVVMPYTVGLFTLCGVTAFSFAGFLVFKAVYTPLVAYVVARWVILRQLAAAGA